MFCKACMGWIEAPFQMYAVSVCFGRETVKAGALAFPARTPIFCKFSRDILPLLLGSSLGQMDVGQNWPVVGQLADKQGSFGDLEFRGTAACSLLRFGKLCDVGLPLRDEHAILGQRRTLAHFAERCAVERRAHQVE